MYFFMEMYGVIIIGVSASAFHWKVVGLIVVFGFKLVKIFLDEYLMLEPYMSTATPLTG